MTEGQMMTALQTPMESTAGFLHGPFYSEGMMWLGQLLLAANPQDSIDLDPAGWYARAELEHPRLFGLAPFDDGYQPWWGIRTRVKYVGLWLTIPHLIEVAGARALERSPALYMEKDQAFPSNVLTQQELDRIALKLAAAFTRPE